MWTKADTTEYVFPNALGWYQIFQISDISVPVTIPYGSPFYDVSLQIVGDIGYSARMVESHSYRSRINSRIDAEAEFPSPRLTFTVDEHEH